MPDSIEHDSTIEVADADHTPPQGPGVRPAGFEHRRLKEALRQELFGHAHDGGRIGRFTVLRRLGAGGMGVVYSAYDDELERKVAIKLLRTDRRSDSAEARLRREAQAIARLSHPNVIGVFEVGRHGGALFLAMEFVRGETLREWQSSPRAVQEILDTYLQAAAGLQAAHEADLVHRDFKPDNVMVGEDGRVRVLDFGLAAAVGESAVAQDVTADAELPSKLTLTGTVLGTPRYMAPEQHDGLPADARSDQYSFCVSLWEALHGECPAKRPGHADVSPRETSHERGLSVPPAIHKVLTRGLEEDPGRRWPSMQELITALQRSSRRRRRRVWWGVGIGATALVAVRAITAGAADCPDPAAKLADVWDRSRVEAARAAMAASERGLSLGAWQELETEIDAYAARWSSALEATCDSSLEQEERLERQLCLEQHLNVLRGLTENLSRGELDPVQVLPDPTSCADVDQRQARVRLQSQKAAPAPVGSEAGLISDFEEDMSTAYGAGWHVSTDQIIGGRSTATIDHASGGAGGSAHAMRITGEVHLGSPVLWAGAMFFPGERPMAPANLSSKSRVSFAVRGTPGSYVAMLFTVRTGFEPVVGHFEVTEHWATVSFAVQELEAELYDANAVFIGAGEPGTFELFVDDVRLD
jgi:predicted Ser/Thr protein kinase